MLAPIVARRDPALLTRITGERDLLVDGKKLLHGSGLAYTDGKLVLLGAGVDLLAIIDPDGTSVSSLPLRGGSATPAGAGFQAMLASKDWRGSLLLAFGSGRTPADRRVARVRMLPGDTDMSIFEPRRFFEALDEIDGFACSTLDLSGAALLPKVGDGRERVRLFQRGHGAPRAGAEGPPLPAIVDVQLDALLGYLERTKKEPGFYFGCDLENPRQYDLGSVAGVPITFTDAASLPSGKVVFIGTAEMTMGDEEPEVIASVLGVIEPDGSARYNFINEADGEPTMRRADGVAVLDTHRAYVVADPHSPDLPATLWSVSLAGI